MTGFAAGDIDVLVSTTVIEVGVNVPNATLMIVENAERFGLSQLHQLRGRVGRGEKKSRCVLVSEESAGAAGISGSTSGAVDRLEAMVRTDNGFEIAEADLKTRGPGDFLSRAGSRDIRQSGGLRFRFADLGGDAPLFAAASDSARRLIASDPGLDGHPELRDYLASLQTEGPSAG
jgi:ATP-dependent DNA helicase RecG